MNMTHLKKQEKANPIAKIIGIILLVFIVLSIAICSVALFSIKVTPEQKRIEPMTLGIETSRSSESVTETEKVTTKPTEPTEQTEVSTSVSTQRPTEKQTDSLTETTVSIVNDPSECSSYMLDIANPDYTYHPQTIQLSYDDRELAAKIVMGEFGDGGYTACCLQTQALRDAVILRGSSVEEVYHAYQYDVYGFTLAPNQNCYDAVDYIFGSGGLAVPHRILFMYCPAYASSSWHESQNFVVEYLGVRFFDAW